MEHELLQRLSAELSDLRRRVGRLEMLEREPTGVSVRAYNSANISVANASWTTITLNSERWDTDGIHSTSTNTERLTCQTPGVYVIVGNVRFAANATGMRGLYILLNGATIIGDVYLQAVNSGSVNTDIIVATVYEFAAGDYVSLHAYQNSSGSLNVLVDGQRSPEFMMVRVG